MLTVNKGGKMLTVNEAAKILNTTPVSVYRFIYTGRLKAHKPGGTLVRIYEADLESFIRRNDKKEGK